LDPAEEAKWLFASVNQSSKFFIDYISLFEHVIKDDHSSEQGAQEESIQDSCAIPVKKDT
jgi:hypothetical protein